MEQAPLAESLFKEDQAVMSNQDLNAVLNARIELPRDAKLAVVRFGQMPYWWGWSEDVVRLNRNADDQLLEQLHRSSRLRDVMYLPSLVTPLKMTIPYLREAGARCQAELLLITRSSTRTYDRQKLFGKDETKAYCTVEAILLDVRTGTIPFSTVVNQDFYAKENKSDVSFAETVAKAAQSATVRAQNDVAQQTVAFLAKVDQPSAQPAATQAAAAAAAVAR
jgi:hypothetical protein